MKAKQLIIVFSAAFMLIGCVKDDEISVTQNLEEETIQSTDIETKARHFLFPDTPKCILYGGIRVIYRTSLPDGPELREKIKRYKDSIIARYPDYSYGFSKDGTNCTGFYVPSTFQGSYFDNTDAENLGGGYGEETTISGKGYLEYWHERMTGFPTPAGHDDDEIDLNLDTDYLFRTEVINM